MNIMVVEESSRYAPWGLMIATVRVGKLALEGDTSIMLWIFHGNKEVYKKKGVR